MVAVSVSSAKESSVVRTCGEDAELRAEVESLLAAHQEAGSFIEGSASDVAAAPE